MYRRAVFPKLVEKYCLTTGDAEARTGHNDVFVRDGELPGYFAIVTDEVRAHPYVTPGSDFYVHCRRARQMLFRAMSRTNNEKCSADFSFRGS